MTGIPLTSLPEDRLHAFAPDAERAEWLDARMHRELASSLSHLAEAFEESRPAEAAGLRGAAERISAGQRVGPEAFARYFEIGERALGGDIDAVIGHVAALATSVSRGRGAFDVVARGSAGELDTLVDMRSGGGGRRFAPVPPEVAVALAGRIDAAFDLLGRALPALHDEIRAIVRRVIAAQAPAGARTQFDGASHYQFWGLLFLNPNFHETPLKMVEVLAHESAHSLLFGLTVDETLVLNPDEELYPSPLRADPRPMDGIYHATFVSARMAWAMEGMAASGLLSDSDRAEALEAARQDRENFAAGIGVVDAHGQLSATGRSVIEGARAWIDG
ncbi:MAG: aKG-HExxH-type peptide beta-hydroxylase [Pseudooceanicola sp.]